MKNETINEKQMALNNLKEFFKLIKDRLNDNEPESYTQPTRVGKQRQSHTPKNVRKDLE